LGRHSATLRQVIQAWQAKDIDGVLAHMHDDIVWHYAAAAHPPVRGKVTARKLLERFQTDMHGIEWRIFAHAESSNRLFIEGVDDYRTTQGHRVAAPYAGVLEFDGDLIIGWRDYVDMGVLDQQRAGQPLSSQVESLIARTVAS
jgi:limonene-1,2-epoxide hydrolase